MEEPLQSWPVGHLNIQTVRRGPLRQVEGCAVTSVAHRPCGGRSTHPVSGSAGEKQSLDRRELLLGGGGGCPPATLCQAGRMQSSLPTRPPQSYRPDKSPPPQIR